MTDITVADKTSGDTLTAAEFQQLLDALKNGTLSITTDLSTGATSKFGDVAGGNYTEVMADGTVRAYGTATAWDDIRVPVEGTKKVSGKEAKDVAYKGGVILKFEDGSDQAISFTVQLPHDWLQGSDIEFHIHYVLPSSGGAAGAENVKFDFTHSWANVNAAFPAETTVSKTSDFQAATADVSGIIEVGTLDATGKTFSSQIICSLTRDVSVADNLADDIYVTEVDFHYQRDSFGTAQEYVKDPA